VGELGQFGAGQSCEACRRRFERDDVDILRLADADLDWPHVPSRFASAVLRAASWDQVSSAMTDGEPRLTRRQQTRLLHPSDAVAAVLVPTRPGTTALDIGTGWSMLPSALSSLGAAVAVVDWSLARLRFGQLMYESPADIAAHWAPTQTLPFADRSFDFAFADVEGIRHALSLQQQRAGARTRHFSAFISDLRRVLKDGGTVVLATRNQLRSVKGEPESAHGSTRGGALGEWRIWRSVPAPWDAHGIRDAGFGDIRVMVPLPDRDDWQWLVPEERLREHLTAPRPRTYRRPSSREWARRAAARVGAGKWTVPDYYVLARAGPRTERRPRTLYESIEELAGDRPPSVRRLSGARLAVVGEDLFVKVPLAEDQKSHLAREVENTSIARGTGFGPFTLPWSRVETWHGVPYTVFPRVDESVVPRETRLAALAEVLDAQDPGAVAPLAVTAIWRRIGSARGGRDVDELEAEVLRRYILGRCADRVVPVGATHGDLHVGNVIVRPGAPPLLVDWNRFERLNPLLLDPARVAISNHRKRTGSTLAEAQLAFIDGEQEDPFADRARSLVGDLDPLEAATIMLLDRIIAYSWPRRRYKPWFVDRLRDAARALVERVEETTW
jgi:SAM-dependent methyltransferase